MTESWMRLPGRARHLAPALTIPLLLAGAVTGTGPAGAPTVAPAAACPAWSGPPPPSPGADDNELNGVAVLSPCDAWAVGDQHSGGVEQTLIEHWDGTAWTVVPSPAVGPSSQLRSVRGTSASDVWAVGSYFDDTANMRKTLILHWNGSGWTQVPSPSPGISSELFAVAASSTGNIWAVGESSDGQKDYNLPVHCC